MSPPPSSTLPQHQTLHPLPGGGIIAWLVAAAHPHMVDRLIVLAAPHIGLAQINPSASQAIKSWYIALFQVRLVQERADRLWTYQLSTVSTLLEQLMGEHAMCIPDIVWDVVQSSSIRVHLTHV